MLKKDSSCVPKTPTLETIQMPINSGTDACIVVESYPGTLPNSDKYPTATCKNTPEFHKHNAEQKKPERKRLHIVCVHLYEMQKQAKLIGSVEVRIMAAHGAGR